MPKIKPSLALLLLLCLPAIVLIIAMMTGPNSCERAQARYDERVTGKAVPVSVAAPEMAKVLEACAP